MGRFGILLCLAGLLATGIAAAQPVPGYSGISHVQFQVSDPERSLQFYRRLFGEEARKSADGEFSLKLGTSHMQLGQAGQGDIAWVALGVEHFDAAMAQHYLEVQGIASEIVPELQGRSGNVLKVTDGDRITTRLQAPVDWDDPPQGATPLQPSPEAPLFTPLLVDEVHITVTNMEVDSLFYSRLLGQTGVLQAGSLWFDIGRARLRLSQAPVGQSPGIVYIAVLISNTDLDAAAEAVFSAGGLIETVLPHGFSFWDPDGLRVLVRTTDMF